MRANWSRDVPVLFFNSGGENREAYRSLVASGIECEFRAASEEPTPLLLVGYQRIVGLEEIKAFLSERRQGGGLPGVPAGQSG